MIELQNEQLADCRCFDEATFNYPRWKISLLFEPNLSLLATPLAHRPGRLRFLSSLYSPAATSIFAFPLQSILKQLGKTIFYLLSIIPRASVPRQR